MTGLKPRAITVLVALRRGSLTVLQILNAAVDPDSTDG